MDLREIDNRVYLEDSLLTWKVLQILYRCHDLKVERVLRHVRVAGFEVDAVAEAYTIGYGIRRLIGFELKDSDFFKAFSQAKERREYFDYFYVVIDLSVNSIVSNLLSLKDLDGIGFVSAYDDVLVIASKFKKRKRDNLRLDSRRIVDKNQIELFNFIRRGNWEDIR